MLIPSTMRFSSRVHLLKQFNKCYGRTSATSTDMDNTFTDMNNTSSETKSFSQIPGPGGLYTLPYIGTALLYKPFSKHSPVELQQLVAELRKKYGDIFKIRMGNEYWVIISHPDYVKSLFQTNYEKHPRLQFDLLKIRCEREGGRKLPLGLRKGKEWEALRKPAQQKMLRPAVVATYVPLIGKVANDFIVKLKTKDKIDNLVMELATYTTESIGMLCFNRRLRSFDETTDQPVASLISESFVLLLKSVLMPVKTFLYFKTKFYKQYANLDNRVTQMVLRELTSQKEFLSKIEQEGKLEEYLEKEPNFMYSLLSDPQISMDDACTLILDMFGAGIDSTANGMAFLLIHLAVNQDKQEELYREIQRVVGDSETLTKEHLGKMSYLKACLKESQRKTNPLPLGAVRILESDLIVGGYHIPKNTTVGTDMQSMSNDEQFFPQPHKFMPERWLRESDDQVTQIREYPFALKPFGYGPRSCLGQRFAENKVYVGITKIIQNFRIELSPGNDDVKITWKLFTTPAEKVVLFLKSRSSNTAV